MEGELLTLEDMIKPSVQSNLGNNRHEVIVVTLGYSASIWRLLIGSLSISRV